MARTRTLDRSSFTRWFASALIAALSFTTGLAGARVYCAPRVGADGQVVMMCGDDARQCLVVVDQCQPLEPSPECRIQSAMFCYAEDEPSRGTRIDCFADMPTCEHARQQGRDARGSGTTTCRRYARHPPYRLLNQTTPPPPRDAGTP